MNRVDVRTIRSYNDLVSDADLSITQADAISVAIADGRKIACVVPDFIANDPEKDLTGFDGCEHIVAGVLEHETGAAVLIRDPQTGDEDWLPKSEIILYEAAIDASIAVRGGA